MTAKFSIFSKELTRTEEDEQLIALMGGVVEETA